MTHPPPPPTSLWTGYWFYVTALGSAQNTVIIVQQKVNVAFFCLSDKRIEAISPERIVGYIYCRAAIDVRIAEIRLFFMQTQVHCAQKHRYPGFR